MEASRIANVTAAWLGGRGPARSTATSIAVTATLFEDTLWVGAASRTVIGGVRCVPVASGRRDFVSGLATAIVAARGERVVVMPVEAASAGAELALALVAWPERAVVAVIDDAVEASFCGIHRRADLVERARSVLDETRPVPSLAAFLSGLEVERVDLAQLGLADRPLMLFTGSEAR